MGTETPSQSWYKGRGGELQKKVFTSAVKLTGDLADLKHIKRFCCSEGLELKVGHLFLHSALYIEPELLRQSVETILRKS